jgi:iron complex outermembrane receptor protein
MRVWGKFDDMEGLSQSGDNAADSMDQSRGGFRLDWQAAENHSLTFSGDYFTETNEDSVPIVDLSVPGFQRYDNRGEDKQGGYLLGRWEWERKKNDLLSLQAYYARNHAEAALLDYMTDTLDVELNHSVALGARNHAGWGLGFRYLHDETKGPYNVSYEPADDDSKVYSVYVQDEFSIIPQTLTLTFGAKAEHNSYSGWEFQPTGRFLWKAAEGHTVWGAVSRAVRTPSRSDVAVEVDVTAFPGPGGVPVVVHTSGDPDMASEKVLTWELGYRTWPNPRISIDVTAFYSRYDNLVGGVLGSPNPQATPAPFRIITPVALQNALKGHSNGVEFALRVEPADWWRINFNYTWLNVNLDAKVEGASTAQEESSPEHQANLLSSFNIGEKWQISPVLRYVGKVRQYDLPAYLEGDLQLSWRPIKTLELALAGRNLFDPHHPEFQRATFGQAPLEVDRSAFAKVTWKF